MCTEQGGLSTDEMAAATASDKVQAIDVHGHYGAYRSDKKPPMDEFCSADAATVVARARHAQICLTIVSPFLALMPRGQGDAVAGNEEARRIVGETEGLMQWVVVNPLAPKTFDQAAEMLALPQCAGIKIHPEEHRYAISEYGQQIFEFAAEHNAVVVTHSGEPNSMPEDYTPFVNDFPEATLILAHLGFGWDDDPTHQVRVLQASRHGNVYIDTSSGMSLTPRLIEWAVGEVGAERLLYGSDTPCYFAPMQRARIDHAEISTPEKRLILRDNAIGLFQLESNSAT